MKKISSQSLWSDIEAIRKSAPLIHNITNYVVMDQTANSLLALGASPVMAHALEEVAEMISIASSLILNIGTLSPTWVEAMLRALAAAHVKKIPIVLDPVGAGATAYRTCTAHAILNQGGITAIRGNAAEILSLVENQNLTKGVDSLIDSAEYLEQAKSLALAQKCIVWMSGKTDAITNGQSMILVHNGHALMAKVVGIGCTASAITGAFLAVNPDPLLGCAHASVLMGIAGEIAAEKGGGPGSFKLAFIDALYNVRPEDIQKRMRVEMR